MLPYIYGNIFLKGKFLKEKFISTNELANDASKILRELKNGEGVVVLRYSEPAGVLITWEDYKRIENMQIDQVNECKVCLGTLKAKKVK